MKAELELRVSENEEEKPSAAPKQEERGRGRRNDFQSARDHRGMLVIPGEAFTIEPWCPPVAPPVPVLDLACLGPQVSTNRLRQ